MPWPITIHNSLLCTVRTSRQMSCNPRNGCLSGEWTNYTAIMRRGVFFKLSGEVKNLERYQTPQRSSSTFKSIPVAVVPLLELLPPLFSSPSSCIIAKKCLFTMDSSTVGSPEARDRWYAIDTAKAQKIENKTYKKHVFY